MIMFWFCLLGFFGIVIVGIVGHFVYNALCRNKWVAWGVPVNESTWEHLKLAVMPMMVWYLIGLLSVNAKNYSFGVFVAIVLACILITVIFYTYTGYTKRPILAVDICAYIVAVALSCHTAYNIFQAEPLPPIFNLMGVFGIVIIFICFVTFTYFTPKYFLFKDPITQKYGLDANQKILKYCNEK